LWERSLKSREGTRPGVRGRSPLEAPPRLSRPPAPAVAASPPAVTSLRDPASESDKVRALYETLREARRQSGESEVPFERFQEVVRAQVSKLGRDGGEVVFKVTTKEGRVAFTAKPAGSESDES
jgi:hypothetical protein